MPPPTPQTGHSAPVGFIKFPAVKGESWSEEHEGQIPIVSFRMGTEHTSGAKSEGGKQRSKVTVSDLMFTAVASTASPQLFIRSTHNKPFPTVILTLSEKNGPEVWDYLTITMTDVIVSGYQLNMQNTYSEPLEEVALNFRKIEFKYTGATKDNKPGSTSVTSYDAATGGP